MPSQPVPESALPESALPESALPEPALISVVVPVYGIGDYLPACLDSLLAHPAEPGPAGPAIEVIAVDDASPDGSGRLLDARAGLDPRLSVLHLASNAGPGHARNIGLARATGRYVWFVDGDDMLPAGALAAVAARLLRDRPDVLLIDYEECYPGGRTRPNPGSSLLCAAPVGTFSLADSPQLINLTMTSWSKLFRRDFLLGLDEPFRPGIHEDIPVTCAALLAGRISALDRVCYSYRRSRPGSFMTTTTSEHWGVFGAYEEVLDMLRKSGTTAPSSRRVGTGSDGRADPGSSRAPNASGSSTGCTPTSSGTARAATGFPGERAASSSGSSSGAHTKPTSCSSP